MCWAVIETQINCLLPGKSQHAPCFWIWLASSLCKRVIVWIFHIHTAVDPGHYASPQSPDQEITASTSRPLLSCHLFLLPRDFSASAETPNTIRPMIQTTDQVMAKASSSESRLFILACSGLAYQGTPIHAVSGGIITAVVIT